VQSFDTNVLVRLLVRDDEEQCQRAEALFRRTLADYVILGSARRQNALPLWTFDRHLADADGAKQVP
jgi:predicted nucleic acid-binding protein